MRTGALCSMPVTPGVAAPSGYGFQCVLPRQDFTQAVTKVTEALKTEGFGILTEIDVQAIVTETAVLSIPMQRDEGGVFRVGGTRVTLDSVVAAWDQGADPEEIELAGPIDRLHSNLVGGIKRLPIRYKLKAA